MLPALFNAKRQNEIVGTGYRSQQEAGRAVSMAVHAILTHTALNEASEEVAARPSSAGASLPGGGVCEASGIQEATEVLGKRRRHQVPEID